MASFVVDWNVPTACTSAVRLSKKVLILDRESPLMMSDISQLFKSTKPGMKIILQEKTERWIGVIESKWGKYQFLEH